MITPNDERLDACYRQYFPLIREKCRRMLLDTEEARDVAQETFIRLWRKPELLEMPVPMRVAWIYRTSTHLAIDRLRRARTRIALAPAAAHDPEDAIVQPEEVIAQRRLLAEVARELKVDELEAMILTRLDGLTHAEAALVMKTSERTLRRVLARVGVRLANLGAPYV